MYRDYNDNLDLHDSAGYYYSIDQKLNDEHDDIEKYGAFSS